MRPEFWFELGRLQEMLEETMRDPEAIEWCRLEGLSMSDLSNLSASILAITRALYVNREGNK